MNYLNLTKFYCFLALVSILAVTQSLVFPRKPQASRISSEKMNLFMSNVASNRDSINHSIITREHSDHDISHSPVVSFKINSNSILFLANAQVRDPTNFSVSFITESIKSLKLDSSAVESKQSPVYLSKETEVKKIFQTCFVSGNSPLSIFGLDHIQLTSAVDQVNSNEENYGFKRFLGLRPSRRYQCMLVTLKSTLPRQESYQLWHDLLKKLQTTFTNSNFNS
jgi:hypothetical protein